MPAKTKECPFADVTKDVAELESGYIRCPFHLHRQGANAMAKTNVKFETKSGRFVTSAKTTKLLEDIGGSDKIREFATRFYAHGFLDSTLKPFFFLDDGATAHGQRLADFIIQEMGGDVVGSHFWGAAHAKARNCSKRHPSVRGNNFNVVDSRTWMRLHFWAARECGFHLHRAFWRWYISFIQHHIAFYTDSAASFTYEDSVWSMHQHNIDAYVQNGHRMPDFE
ncbi:Aste57867_13694 [Aphanomyces stellatus]|uniref:Aste57867_13694 protein n=1 Tax=Aphanomyces stellatus TaxID=120398 RepID=A0A485KZB7_9STRA|nr:hypothetical protein As57867_013644 [Aphanomyces stellatus]VFT90527.1 Aste57867_13694 [Aphanomyces stellatus]